MADLEVVTRTTVNGQRLHSITLQIPHALVKERDAKIPFPDGHVNTLNRVCHLPRDNLNLLGRLGSINLGESLHSTDFQRCVFPSPVATDVPGFPLALCPTRGWWDGGSV